MMTFDLDDRTADREPCRVTAEPIWGVVWNGL